MKHIFFLAICLLVAGSVTAQTYYYGPHPHHAQRHPSQRHDDYFRPRFGITGGISIANTISSYNYYYSTASIIGANAGLTAELPIAYGFSFQGEVLFSQKGYQAITTDGIPVTQRNDYIDIPLLAKFQLFPGFNFLIGPQINIPISNTTTYTNGYYASGYYNYGYKSYIAGAFGVSIDVTRNFDLHARYLIDLSSNSYDINSPIPDYRNQVWQFGIGFKFR
jgi:hypothetical protein